MKNIVKILLIVGLFFLLSGCYTELLLSSSNRDDYYSARIFRGDIIRIYYNSTPYYYRYYRQYHNHYIYKRYYKHNKSHKNRTRDTHRIR